MYVSCIDSKIYSTLETDWLLSGKQLHKSMKFFMEAYCQWQLYRNYVIYNETQYMFIGLTEMTDCMNVHQNGGLSHVIEK